MKTTLPVPAAALALIASSMLFGCSRHIYIHYPDGGGRHGGSAGHACSHEKECEHECDHAEGGCDPKAEHKGKHEECCSMMMPPGMHPGGMHHGMGGMGHEGMGHEPHEGRGHGMGMGEHEGSMRGGMGPMGAGGATMGPVCSMETGPLDAKVRTGIERALADERRADVRYEAASVQFPPGRQFLRAERAEDRQVSLLERLLLSHGAGIPASAAIAAQRFTSVKDACADALKAERANIAMYEELLKGQPPADVRCVFEQLARVSRDRQLPALERCQSAKMDTGF